MMKKILKFSKKRRGFSPSSSDAGSILSIGYEIKEKDLGKVHKAASLGDLTKLKQLAKKNDLNQLDKENRTPLHIACAYGHTDVVLFLVENKAKLNLCDNQNRSPLMKAVQCQQETCAALLLEHSADPNLVDINGNTALHLAALIPSVPMGTQLLEHGANINADNKDGCTPLILAVTENHTEMVEFLLKEGADVNAKDQGKRTSLIIAACNGQISMIRLLLANNADIAVKDEKGWTSDDYAVINGHHACSHLIIEHGTRRRCQHSPSFPGQSRQQRPVGSPGGEDEAAFSLGRPASNRDELHLAGASEAGKVDDNSQVESISRASKSAAGDSWLSSDEDDGLQLSPKKPQKVNLKKLISSSEKGRKRAAADSRSWSERESDAENDDRGERDSAPSEISPPLRGSVLPPPSPSPAPFSKPPQVPSTLLRSSRTEENSTDADCEEEEEDEDSKEEELGRVEDKVPHGEHPHDDGERNEVPVQKRDFLSELGLGDRADDDSWDSPVSESPRKLRVGINSPATPKEESAIVPEKSDEGGPCDDLQQKPGVSNAKPMHVLPTPAVTMDNTNVKIDLMEELGLGDVDDLEDPSDWDSSSSSCTSHRVIKQVSPDEPHPLASDKEPITTPPSTVVPASGGEEPATSVTEGSFENTKSALAPPNGYSPRQAQIKPQAQPRTRKTLATTGNEEETSVTEVLADDAEDLSAGPEMPQKGKDVLDKSGLGVSELYHSSPVVCETQGVQRQEDGGETDEDSDASWEKRYEKIWVETEKREVKSHYRSVTAELKEKFGELCWRDARGAFEAAASEESSRDGGGERVLVPIAEQRESGLEDSLTEPSEGLRSSQSPQPTRNVPSNEKDAACFGEEIEKEEQLGGQEEAAEHGGRERNACRDLSYSGDGCSVSTGVGDLGPEGGSQAAATAQKTNEDTEAESKCLGDVARRLSDEALEEDMQRFKYEVCEEMRELPTVQHHHPLRGVEGQRRSFVGENVKEELSERGTNSASEKEPEAKLNQGLGSKYAERFAAAGSAEVPEEMEIGDDFDDLTQSSDTGTDEADFPASGFRNASLLIQQLDSSCIDSVSMVKLQTMFHEYECTIQREKGRCSRLSDKVSQLEEERANLKQVLEETRDVKSILEHRQVDLETELKNFKFVLKQEQEKHRNACMLHDKGCEQLRVKEEQYHTEVQERQKVELAKRNLELEMRALVNSMKQLEDDHSETQRLLAHERSTRTVQEGILTKHMCKQRELEEENMRNFTKSSEAALRQLQQELADTLKKLSMSEASLEVNSRYRNDLEEEKLRLQKDMDRLRGRLQESEDQYVQAEQRIHELKRALDDKERDAITSSQRLQEALAAAVDRDKMVKQLEEAMQKLEIENVRLEASAKQQMNRMEVLQRDSQEAAETSDSSPGTGVRNRLEDLVTDLQGSKITLEDKLSREVQKQNLLSHSAQDTHRLWEEEMKARARLSLRLAELEREKGELSGQAEIERKRAKKTAEQKKSTDIRLDQEMSRNAELQKDISRLKVLLKTAKKRLREQQNMEPDAVLSKPGDTLGRMKSRVDELTLQLQKEEMKCTKMEALNSDLKEQLSSLKALSRTNEHLERGKRRLEEEVAGLQRQMESSRMDQNQLEHYCRDAEERARQEVRQKLEEVNLFLQTQAASQEALEQMKAANEASLRAQQEQRMRELEDEMSRLRGSQNDSLSQKESALTELQRYRELYSQELQLRKSLAAKLERSNERLGEANAKLLGERQRTRSLIAGSMGGSLIGPSLDVEQLNPAGPYGGGLASGFLDPAGTGQNTKVETFLAKMQNELEKNITRELDKASAELGRESARLSPVGSVAVSQRSLSTDQDPVARATQQYLDVLKKNYRI
ncbi:ankyrin repeat domain-containing protein 26 isoform X5 [Brienomyrus brachyistius]|uniref:ankyrin repeat domain-containing protein 26 isoform X5 n=1 Tax=Brienomyrus brachyistius TaxID=42636 RepID=UPI0020B4380C|nr:ankyrin repeat domain-containing protein 26 isoform X5 [Brienomyrus brachyistius]